MTQSIRSIQEMVRQYTEELSCQNTNNDVSLRSNVASTRKSLKSEEIDCKKITSSPNEELHARTKKLKDKKNLCWHDSHTGNVTQEKTFTPLRISADDLRDFQDLDCRASNVLRYSQQVIEGQACKYSVAFISKSDHLIHYIKNPSYFTGNEKSSPENADRRSDKNHSRVRDVVTRNFEEIDQILGESNLVMEEYSSSNFEHTASKHTKDGKEIRLGSKELGFELERSFYGGAKFMKQDMEAREEVAVKAANFYLQKNDGDSTVQSEKLFKISFASVEENLDSNGQRSLTALNKAIFIADPSSYPSIFNPKTNNEKANDNGIAFQNSRIL